ncbi:DUF4150 domain-containing protein [Marinomonas mediterranea]|uniref:DUF4150 domain-containing protein n=1 Tax=Marinomonas mediterranea TaxID=119864 RepID=UPI00234AF80D|nr:DUF4150 domain-containing protein [Marinomonas mediterranea]WCN10225.1 DUF4150 domain-containing protein [Marinomonas mediterranea]
MSNNVLINGRTAVHAGSNGTVMAIDVCLTQVGPPVVPIPYMNASQSADADKTADSVKINGNPACHVKSVFAKSSGDEAGNRKGIVSGKISGEASFMSSSFDVLIEGEPAVRAMDLMVSNAQNTPPMPLMQAVGMPALAATVTAPEELEAITTNVISIDQYSDGNASGYTQAEEPSE